MSAFFGLYYKPDSTVEIRDNIKMLAPDLWSVVSDDAKTGIGLKIQSFLAIGDQEAAAHAMAFLDLVGGKSYIPKSLLTVEIRDAITNLLAAHRGSGNFYAEPIFSRNLVKLVSGADGVSHLPRPLLKEYIYAIVECFVTNGNGVAYNASQNYIHMLSNLNEDGAKIAALSFKSEIISGRLMHMLCRAKFVEMLKLLINKFTNDEMRNLVEYICNREPALGGVVRDVEVSRRIKNLKIAGVLPEDL